MEQLTLLKSEEKEKEKKSWQQSFAGIFYYKYKEVTGETCRLGFGALKKMLNQHAQKFWVDEETGAPEIPSIEIWQDEVEAFFQDQFAAEQRGFHFSYLLKQFGSFKKHKVTTRKPSDPILIHKCSGCGREFKHPKSFWQKLQNKIGTCPECHKTFNVNDVINQIISLSNILQQ